MHIRLGSTAPVDTSAGIEDRVQSTVRMYVSLEFPVQVEMMVRGHNSLFSRRHGLDVMGWVRLPELRMDFVFRRHDRAEDRPDEARGTTTVVPPGFRLSIPAQSIDRTRPERQDLWVMTSEPQRRPPWLEHYVGPCDGRRATFERPIQAGATLDVSCRAIESQKGQETRVETWGELSFERPISMRLMLRGTDRTISTGMDSMEMNVVMPGTRIPMERQTLAARVSPRPWIGMRVSDGEGRALCPEHALGDGASFW